MDSDTLPFDYADADAILRTSDGISFKVHTQILKVASPFFRNIFSLPHSTSDQSTLACVDVPEKGKVMRPLLTFAYPLEDPQTLKLDSHFLFEVLSAALKYEISGAIQSLRRLLVSPQFMREPLRVYAIACRHHLEEEMELASKGMLAIDLRKACLVEELKDVTASDYHRLITFHDTCSRMAQELLQSSKGDVVPCGQCGGKTSERWWREFVALGKAKLLRVPTTDKIFSAPFLEQVAASAKVNRCYGCARSILASHELLAQLKRSIDALPDTIQY